MLELALELADKESRLLLVPLVEDLADADEHGPGNRGHGSRHSEREKQQQLLPKAHCASSSETPARSGAPSAASRRSRTRPLTAKARGRYSKRNQRVTTKNLMFNFENRSEALVVDQSRLPRCLEQRIPARLLAVWFRAEAAAERGRERALKLLRPSAH